MQKVNVLGTEYTIKMDVPQEDMPLDSDGCIDPSIKTIMIVDFGEPDKNSIKDLESYKKETLRHEIVHAFLYESGLWSNSGNVKAWGHSEEITDWIALQFPKMLQAFIDVDAIDLPEGNIVTKEVTVDSSKVAKAVMENVKKQLEEHTYYPRGCS